MTERSWTEAPPPPRFTAPDDDYPGTTKAGGVLLTVFAPLFALIAALLLMGPERNPVRRESLKQWAWLSTAIMAIELLVGAIIFLGAFWHF